MRCRDAESRLVGGAVNTLRAVLQGGRPGGPQLEVSRILEAGVHGKRTLVYDTFDADVIAHVVGFRGRQLVFPLDWRNEALLFDMRLTAKAILKETTSWTVSIPQHKDVVQVYVEGVELDLMLAPDCVPAGALSGLDPVWQQHMLLMGPVYDDPEAAHRDALRERANAAALAECLQGQSAEVQGVVLLARAWYKLGVCDGVEPEEHVGSGALAALVLAADKRLAERGHTVGQGDIYQLELFLEVLRLIDEVVTRGSVVMVDAGEWGYRRELGMRCARNWENDKVKIIHPIDPTCNLARECSGRRRQPDWEGLASEARQLLRLASHASRGEGQPHTSTLGRTEQLLHEIKGL
ncbi:hypothetical protein GPECTOR_67g291 [Gonium pectorale]|uniref:Uncharacterized protein n=1 Tax=Gonium pectorale TaxID=33097 RepID=A0A150G3R2_GONPE|nr:hypothetical protein GPECTOR_67g291 [Gonium pectorale]|eukprot:KXZ44451.1 hypothetical protein GPECTOR_67g291 [Gonium pectorale]